MKILEMSAGAMSKLTRLCESYVHTQKPHQKQTTPVQSRRSRPALGLVQGSFAKRGCKKPEVHATQDV